MKQSRLHAQHVLLGATFEEVAGWEMPAHYGDVVAYIACSRKVVGDIDVGNVEPLLQALHQI